MWPLLMLACQSPNPAPERPTEQLERRAVHRSDGRRVVAIGDLHGDRAASIRTLQLAGLTDAEGRWTGGDTVFVQTGDTTDRGPDSKGVIDLMRSLQEPARKAGGEVLLLNGNHEVMNLQGDWRYVSPGDLEGFGGQERRRQAFSQEGEYGRFLSELPVAVQVDETVFVHGGITESFAELGLERLNALARQHYRGTPGPQGHPVHGEYGPTWFRGYVRAPEEQACPALEAALQHLGARRMVVGHTTQRTGDVLVRCDGRLAVIDVGISAHYGGHVGAWESTNGDARFLRPEGAIDLPDPEPVARPARPE